MHTRRKILLLHGVPEDQKEDTLAVTVKEIVQRCKLPDVKPEDINRCHRMGRSSAPDRPRPILFKLRDMSLRGRIWAAKSNLRGSGITMSEFLTKSRHDTFMAARQVYGVSKCWTRDGFIFVLGLNGSRHRVSCMAELNKLQMQTQSKATVPASAALKPSSAAAVKEPQVAAKPRRAAAKRIQ